MAIGGDMKLLITMAITVGSLAVISLTTIAVITGYKETLLVDNTVADNFIAGIAIIATFITIIILAVIGKVIVRLSSDGTN